MKKERIIGPLFCVSAALIWGLSFVAQKTGASIGTFTFNGIRTFIGGLVMIPAVIFVYARQRKNFPGGKIPGFDLKGVLKGGLVCGFVLFCGGNLQQHAFTFDIEAGKVAFITALYMILVPIIGIFIGKSPGLNVWAGLALGITGLYFICIKKGSFAIGKGELFSLACAVCFALHILVIDHYCRKVDNLVLSCVQYLIAGGLSIICMFIFEGRPEISTLTGAAVPLLYAGIGSCTFAFTFQVYGQKYTEPSVAALLLCLESVFAALFGFFILRDELGARALAGCGIMLAGVVLTQIDFKSKGKLSGGESK